MPDDLELLRRFAATADEAAFATLVERHVALVHSVALRVARNPDAAQEITSAVFIVLARKARTLDAKTVLPGWLYHTARLTAANYVRGEIRRARRESEALMELSPQETEAGAWEHIAPLLETAMARLNPADRDVVVLRYFQNKTMEELAAILHLPETTARKRVTRAVEKLRRFFVRRGVTLSATLLAGALTAHSVSAAPVALATTIATTTASGTAISTNIATLVKGTIRIMTYTKKLMLGIGAVILLAGSAATVTLVRTGRADRWTPQEIAQHSAQAYAALSSYSDSGTVVVESSVEPSRTTFTTRLARPNRYRINWNQTIGAITRDGSVWSEGNGDFMTSGPMGSATVPPPQRMNDRKQALATSAAVSGRGTATIPEAFFDPNGGDTLAVAALGRSELQKLRDEKVDGVDCSVFSSTIDLAKLVAQGKTPKQLKSVPRTGKTVTTFWIGKRDHFIHQMRTSVENFSFAFPHQSDTRIKSILEGQNKPATPEAIAAWRTQMEAMMSQAQSTKIIFTATHEHIVANPKLSPADFAR